MIRAWVVDDEQPAREELALLLAGTGAVEVVGMAANAVEAIAAIRRVQPDVLFLDVQMPMVNGFELLGLIDDDVMPEVVFVTAHDAFALEAFEKNAIDYLLKPVSPERLKRTVERLQRRTSPAPRSPLSIQSINRVPCLGPRTIKLVNVSEIELVKSTISGVYVVCAREEYSTDLTLQLLEARAGMLRCHKQYLVNADAVDVVSLGDGPVATLRTRSGHVVPVSRRHLAQVRLRLGL